MKRNWISSTTLALFLLGTIVATAQAANSPINYPKPSSTKKMTIPLVRAYNKCTAANTSWDAPFSSSACVPPVEDSVLEFGPSGRGSITFQVVTHNSNDYNENGSADSPFDSDVVITSNFRDIRNEADGTPYSGDMGGGLLAVRVTSTDNVPVAGNGSGTTANTTFPLQDPQGQDCVNGKCKISTSIDATIPGTIVDGEKSSWEIGVPLTSSSGQIILSDPSGDAFATPGFVVE